MSDLYIPHEKEPRNLYVNTENRPHITFFDAESAQNLDVDISLAQPWSQGILKRSSREDGFAARTREEKKTNKYTGEIQPRGTSSKCIPLVFEHFGKWGLQADAFLHTLSRNSAAVLRKTPFVVQNNSKLFVGNLFSLILQRCNAKVILKKLSRVLETKNDTDKLLTLMYRSKSTNVLKYFAVKDWFIKKV